MLLRALGVLGSVASIYALWALFLPVEMSRTGLVSLGVLGLIGLIGSGLAQRNRPATSIFQVLRGVDAEPAVVVVPAVRRRLF